MPIEKFTTEATEVVEAFDKRVESTVAEAGRAVRPMQQSAFRRFPTLFTLLTTAGVVATFMGMENILKQYHILNDYPWLTLLFGLAILLVTGTLYKKLG